MEVYADIREKGLLTSLRGSCGMREGIGLWEATRVCHSPAHHSLVIQSVQTGRYVTTGQGQGSEMHASTVCCVLYAIAQEVA